MKPFYVQSNQIKMGFRLMLYIHSPIDDNESAYTNEERMLSYL